jgi:pSer/pThr/pTyr-binding forkhead associated (FHA) protein
MTARIILSVTEGNLDKRDYVFEKSARCVVGRADDCAIQLPTEHGHWDVSRHHCAIEIDLPAIRVRDLGSRNGTFVNGEKIGQRSPLQPPDEADSGAFAAQELEDGDEVRVGHAILRIGKVAKSDMPAFAPLL